MQKLLVRPAFRQGIFLFLSMRNEDATLLGFVSKGRGGGRKERCPLGVG